MKPLSMCWRRIILGWEIQRGLPYFSMWPKRNAALINFLGLSAAIAVEKDGELVVLNPGEADTGFPIDDLPLVLIYQLFTTDSL